jgi:hypothetical protein
MKGRRRFVDAPEAHRCKETVKLRDGSSARCGRYAKLLDRCTQHARRWLREHRDVRLMVIG